MFSDQFVHQFARTGIPILTGPDHGPDSFSVLYAVYFVSFVPSAHLEQGKVRKIMKRNHFNIKRKIALAIWQLSPCAGLMQSGCSVTSVHFGHEVIVADDIPKQFTLIIEI